MERTSNFAAPKISVAFRQWSWVLCVLASPGAEVGNSSRHPHAVLMGTVWELINGGPGESSPQMKSG